MRVTLGFLEKLTLFPAHLGADDIIPLRSAGVSDQAIEDALVICALFHIIVRLADAFDVEIPSPEGFVRTGEMLLRLGYD